MWRNFVQTAGSKTIWQLKKYLTAGTTQNTIPTLDEHAETFEQLSQLLGKNFFPEPPPANLQDIRGKGDVNRPSRRVQCNTEITVEQVRRAVHNTAPNKALGPDGITNKVLKQALPEIEGRLQIIMQASLDKGYYPQAFKNTTTVVLRKPHKPDYTKAKAYHPIALENTIGKIFEKVIGELISYLVETNNLLPKNHYGGHPGRSTEDAMVVLTEHIHRAWK
jgi:hypothetical protein